MSDTQAREVAPWEVATKKARKAIYGADGRGMIGRDRNCLEQRVAREISVALKEAHCAGRKAGLEEAQETCRQQEREFLSPEYATHQPLSSFNERFACRCCADAIENLITKPGEEA